MIIKKIKKILSKKVQEGLINYGCHLSDSGKYKDASEVFRLVLGKNSMYFKENFKKLCFVKLKYATCLFEDGQYKKALSELIELKNIVQNDVYETCILEVMAICYEKIGNEKQAYLIKKSLNAKYSSYGIVEDNKKFCPW